jgi:bifunctional DNase/RNase
MDDPQAKLTSDSDNNLDQSSGDTNSEKLEEISTSYRSYEVESHSKDAVSSVENFIQVELINIETVYPDVFPKLVLRGVDDPNLEFAFSVGSFEAVSIANAWRNIKAPRPLTHDLLADIMNEFNISVEEVRILPKSEGNYVGQLVVSSLKGTRLFDCRPSDAIALALRQKLIVPIMCSPKLFEI